MERMMEIMAHNGLRPDQPITAGDLYLLVDHLLADPGVAKAVEEALVRIVAARFGSGGPRA